MDVKKVEFVGTDLLCLIVLVIHKNVNLNVILKNINF